MVKWWPALHECGHQGWPVPVSSPGAFGRSSGFEWYHEVAGLFSLYLSQAIERVCQTSKPAGRAKSNGAPWFDKECKEKRSLAMQAGHRVECNADREMHMVACKNYRALEQRKRRQYHNDCVRIIVDKYRSDKSNVLKTIETLSNSRDNYDGPSNSAFF